MKHDKKFFVAWAQVLIMFLAGVFLPIIIVKIFGGWGLLIAILLAVSYFVTVADWKDEKEEGDDTEEETVA